MTRAQVLWLAADVQRHMDRLRDVARRVEAAGLDRDPAYLAVCEAWAALLKCRDQLGREADRRRVYERVEPSWKGAGLSAVAKPWAGKVGRPKAWPG